MIAGNLRWTALALVTALSACNGPDSLHVDPPSVDAGAVSRQAVLLYDADGDGSLSTDELKKCPGILSAMERFDTDNNQQIIAEEIEARIRQWSEHGVGIMSFVCQVTLDGRPLPDARVEMVPEPFLEPDLKPASGKSRATGDAMIVMDKEHLPPDRQSLHGLYAGLYKVKVTHPTMQLPARYNVSTELGHEVAFDADRMQRAVFAVESR